MPLGILGGVQLGLGVLGGISSVFGGRQWQEEQNRLLQNAANQFSSASIAQRVADLNPFLGQALGFGTHFQTGGLGGRDDPALRARNINYYLQNPDQFAASNRAANPYAQLFFNPGQLNPRMLNYQMEQSARAGQSDLQRTMAILGRRGYAGGQADAFVLANQAATTLRNQQAQLQFDLAREKYRREDMAMGQGFLNDAVRSAGALAQGQAGLLGQQIAPMNSFQQLSQAAGLTNATIGGLREFMASQGQQKTGTPGGQDMAGGGYFGRSQSPFSGITLGPSQQQPRRTPGYQLPVPKLT